MALGPGTNADLVTVLKNLTDNIRKAFENDSIFIQNGHTRAYFGVEHIHDQSHVDPIVDPDKMSTAVVLHLRNTELQRTRQGAYQVAFEAEFDRLIRVTQHSHTREHYFHIVITKNTDDTTNHKYDYMVVMALINSYWTLPK